MLAVILYLDVPCQLPIGGRENMLRYADGIGLGCWAPTLGGGYQIIHEIDGLVQQHPESVASSFETALFHTGTGTMAIVDENANWYRDAMAPSNRAGY